MAITRAQQFRQMLKQGGEPVEQAGVMNYMPSEMITVPKIAKSSPDTPTAKLAYITPKEEDILVNLNLYGSLNGKPNRGPGGLPSLEGDFGSPTGQVDTSPGSGGTYGGAEGPDVSGRTDMGTGDYQVTDKKAQEDYDKNRAIRDYNRRQAKKTEKDKKLNFAERFRVLSLKNLIDQKRGLKGFSPSIFGTIANITTPQLDVYEKSSPDLDEYGMTGEDLTDVDRAIDAIDKAETTGDITQSEFEDAFFGPDGRPKPPKGNDGPKQPIIPIIPEVLKPDEEEKIEETFAPNFRLLAGGGMAERAPYEGGIMDLESARQMYGLGKLVKKVTRSVKKIAKSPVGKAAIGAALFKFGGPLFGKGSFNPFLKIAADGSQGFSPFGALAKKLGMANLEGGLTGLGKITALGLPSIIAGLTTKTEDDDDEEQYAGADLPFPVDYYLSGQYAPNMRLAAEGGLMRAGYQEGSKEPVAKKTMPLLDMDGMEKDYREEGGFVPIGRMEKADDVPARLSKNEFVFTADAVRNAGDGDVDLGAEKMYNMMKNLEAGGDVSEESQGMDGARKMFQTSQRLEEVI